MGFESELAHSSCIITHAQMYTHTHTCTHVHAHTHTHIVLTSQQGRRDPTQQGTCGFLFVEIQVGLAAILSH